MIYTMTLNPALDYVMQMGQLRSGGVNRSVQEHIFSGGKGLNVSIMLHNLGVASIALGFIAGFTGDEIERRIHEKGIQTDFIRLRSGMSRINVKLRAGEETEINASGPPVLPAEIEKLLQKLDLLRSGDILVLSGSVPASLPSRIYERMMERVRPKRIEVVVDASGDLLLRALAHRPFLIKPNRTELCELCGHALHTEKEIVDYACSLQEAGARNILVSLAGDGAILLTEDGRLFRRRSPAGTIVNSVGAGDSMVAGFLYGYLSGGGAEGALRMGIAAGSASAFSMDIAERTKVEEVLHSLPKQNF